MKSIMDFIRTIEAEQPTFTVGSVVKRLAELHQQNPQVLTKFAAAYHDRITKAKEKDKKKGLMMSDGPERINNGM